MPTNSQQHPSYWSVTAPHVRQAPLHHDTQADVCVVGAGIAGLSTAYLLASAGKSVVVLDDGPVGDGQTRQTTAHLSNAIDDRYTEIERWHGAEGRGWQPRVIPRPSRRSARSLRKKKSTATSSAWTATCSCRKANRRTSSSRSATPRTEPG